MKYCKAFSIFFLVFFLSCSRDNSIGSVQPAEKEEKVSSTENHQNARVKWGKNEENYIASMKQHAARLKHLSTANPDRLIQPVAIEDCNCTPNVYSYYDDPENMIHEGAYVSYLYSSQETQMATCPDLLAAIQTARTYLNNEGYSDIVTTLDTPEDRYKLVHAANTLMDLKSQVVNSTGMMEIKMVNCVLQAIGYTAVSALIANWATASRYAILRAVGKLATRYMGWIGAAIAVASFTDCMWG